MSISLDNAIVVRATLTLVQDSLTAMRELALKTDYKDPIQRKVFFDHIVNVKRNYRKMEGVLSSTPVPVIRPPGMKTTIRRTINPSQMEAWVDKIQKNMDVILLNPTIRGLKRQYVFLNMIVKVLNEEAYFVGCMQPDPVAK